MPSKRWRRLRKRIFINRLVPNRINAARSYINAVQLSSLRLLFEQLDELQRQVQLTEAEIGQANDNLERAEDYVSQIEKNLIDAEEDLALANHDVAEAKENLVEATEHLSYAKNARSEAIENHETAVTQGNNLRDIIQQSNQAFTGCSVNVRNIDDIQIIERFAARGWRGVVCYPRNDSAMESVARRIRDFYQDDWIVSRNDPTSSSSAGSPVQFFDSLPPDRVANYVGRGDSTSSSDE